MGLANKPGDFTPADAEIASAFGQLAAIALLKSRHIDLLKQRTESLQHAMSQVKTLRGLLPICSACKKIRNDEGFWTRVEAYLSEHTDAQFTHSICPDCLRKLYPEESAKSPPSRMK